MSRDSKLARRYAFKPVDKSHVLIKWYDKKLSKKKANMRFHSGIFHCDYIYITYIHIYTKYDHIAFPSYKTNNRFTPLNKIQRGFRLHGKTIHDAW